MCWNCHEVVIQLVTVHTTNYLQCIQYTQFSRDISAGGEEEGKRGGGVEGRGESKGGGKRERRGEKE